MSDELSPEVQALFDQARRHYARYTVRPKERTKKVRYVMPPSWDNRGGKRIEWQLDLRAKVGRATLELLAEVGPRGFTVVEVAKRAGVARSSIYKHMGLKAEMIAYCLDNFWWCGEPARRIATERDLYRIALEQLTDNAPDGPRLEDMCHAFTIAALQQAERDLWLLNAAEAIRCKRPPHLRWHNLPPNPLRHDAMSCLRQLLAAGQANKDTIGIIMHIWQALIWYETCLNGPLGDHRWQPEPGRSRPAGRRRQRQAAHAPQHQATVTQAMSWVLEAAGLAGLELTPLPPQRDHKLPQHIRYEHPTGWFIHSLQSAARLYDPDDFEALHTPDHAPHPA